MKFSFLLYLGGLIFLVGCNPTPQDSCICPRIYQPVCGESGVTYGNDCLAACQADAVAFSAPCTALQAEGWLVPPEANAPGCGYQFLAESGETFYPAHIPQEAPTSTTWVKIYYEKNADFPCEGVEESAVIKVFLSEYL